MEQGMFNCFILSEFESGGGVTYRGIRCTTPCPDCGPSGPHVGRGVARLHPRLQHALRARARGPEVLD